MKKRLLALLLVLATGAASASFAQGATDGQAAPGKTPTKQKKAASRTSARRETNAKKADAGTKAPAEPDARANQAAPQQGPRATDAQRPAPEPDFITPHVMNGHEMAIPWPQRGLEKEIELPRWPPIHVGSLEIDLSPTKHVVMLWIAGALCLLCMVGAARSVERQHRLGKPSKGFGLAIEEMVLYLRNEVILPNVGPHGEAFVPYCLAAFFFILFCNLLGLFPYGATATGNISVTATMAVLSFIVIEVAGMRALGKGYIDTIIWWPHDLSIGVKLPITFIMTPVEILGKLTKPFALAMRLFANMTAGHIAVLALIGLVFGLSSYAMLPLAIIPVGLATGIMCLETFVAFLQAFIFMLLSAVFIGLIRSSHH